MGCQARRLWNKSDTIISSLAKFNMTEICSGKFLKVVVLIPECSMHVGSLTESSSFSIESIQSTIYGHFLCDFEICSYWFLQSVLVCNYFYVIEAYKSAVVKLFFSLILL